MGLTSELITAKHDVALYTYLANKGLELPVESMAVIEGYIGQEYSFVVSWISDVEEFIVNKNR